MDLSLVFVAVVAGLVGWKMAARRRSPQQLEAIQQALDAGGVLVDVRTPREFSTGHLPGARNIPVAGIGAAASELKAADRPVILYCASGARAGMAARTLQAAGVRPVLNLGTFGAGRSLRFRTPPAD